MIAAALQNEMKVSRTVTGTTNLLIRGDCGFSKGLNASGSDSQVYSFTPIDARKVREPLWVKAMALIHR